VAEWYTRTNHIRWPADLEELLARKRLAVPGQSRPRTAQTSPIPFRAMTIPELFGGAFKVVLRNWPALLGIPVVILVGFMAIFGVVAVIVMQVLFSATSAMSGGLFMSTAESANPVFTLLAMMLVFIAMVVVLALPADALLIALTVIATDKAVRGEPVRFGEVFRLAKRRIIAVCRLTLAYYGLFTVPMFLITGVTSILAGVLSPAYILLTLLCFVVSFVFGILLSMSPIVLVIEERGVIDSFKRSMQLAKPAWGRLLAIHLVWAACVIPLMVASFFVMWLNPLLYGVAIAFLIAYVRALQMLIYTDLRMRQENYDRELLAEWTRNMGREGLSNA
jgi:hypothetical protein